MTQPSGQPSKPRKIGEGHLQGMLRQGLNELRAAVVDPSSNIAQPTEYGIYGTPTPGEVADKRTDSVLKKHEAKGNIHSAGRSDSQRDDRGRSVTDREGPEPEREP